MRHWRAQPDTSAGALFGYLAAGKSSVTGDPTAAEVLALMAAADLVITDLSAGWTLADVTAAAPPSAVVIAITPFGTTGPYVDAGVGVNEFLLQALCGSIGGRGWPGSEPMQAGGRIGEWFAGTYAGRRRRSVGARRSPQRLRRDHRPVDLRGDGGRHGFVGRGVGQRARRCSGPGPAKRRTAVDRADRRRNGRVLHHHRAAVSGLPGADRTTRPARRRRSGVDGRSDPASRRIPRHGSRLGGRQDHGRNHRNRNGFPNPGGSDRDAADDHDHRPLRGPQVFVERRERSRRAAGPLSQYRDTDPAPRWRAGPGRRQRTGGLAIGREAARAANRNVRRVAADRFACRGLHRVLGRADGDPGAGRPRRRRHQSRRGAASGRHAVRRRTPAQLGPVVGMGPGVPVQQHQQARHQPRTEHAARTAGRAGSHRRTAIWSSRTSRRG